MSTTTIRDREYGRRAITHRGNDARKIPPIFHRASNDSSIRLFFHLLLSSSTVRTNYEYVIISIVGVRSSIESIRNN